MRRNNISFILPFIQEHDDGYYTIEIMVRKKDKNDSKSTHLVKRLRVTSPDELKSKMDFIIRLCDFFGARAYIDLNPKSYRKTAYQTLKAIANYLEHHDYKAVSKAYARSARYLKRSLWMVDADYSEHGDNVDISKTIPSGYYVASIPSKTGTNESIIFKAHDTSWWKHKIAPHTIMRNAIVNLYIP